MCFFFLRISNSKLFIWTLVLVFSSSLSLSLIAIMTQRLVAKCGDYSPCLLIGDYDKILVLIDMQFLN